MTDQPARERFEKALHLALALRDDSRGDAARVEVLRLYDEQTAAMHDMQERHREAVEHLTRQRDERHANPTPDEKASELHRALNELVQPAAPVCGELFVPDGWRNSLLRIRDEMVAERNWQTKYPWTHVREWSERLDAIAAAPEPPAPSEREADDARHLTADEAQGLYEASYLSGRRDGIRWMNEQVQAGLENLKDSINLPEPPR